MASAVSQSSVATVVEDLVSDRSIPLKICMIVLNCLQIISSWVAVCFFFTSIQEWTPMEVGVSGAFLIVGNYIVPGIANGIIYWRRWKRSTPGYRRRMEEENKQAWVCLRIALSLLGIPTVGRYIETIMVSRKLDDLEKKHLHTSVNTHKEGSQLNPVGTSRLGSIINQKNLERMSKSGINQSVISGASQTYNINGVNENSQDKVRKARRQYKRCEHDGAQMALLAGATGAGPLAIAFVVLYLQRIERINMSIDQGSAVIVATVFNVLWLSATLTHFYPSRHVQSEAEFERGVSTSNIGAIILLYISHLIQVVLRIICLAIFANWFTYFVLIFIGFHWIVGLVILIVYRFHMKTKTLGTSMISCSSFLSALFFGYVGIFDFVNGNEGKTRLRYLVFYLFYYIENIIMLVLWIARFPTTQIRYPIPFVCVILGLFWLGFLFLQLYLYYFSYSPYGSSIIGCCKGKDKHKSVNYVEEVREPVFGVPLAQSAVPLWQHQQPDNITASSRISGTTNPSYKYGRLNPLDHGNTPSIMSIPSAKSPPSILSQTPGYSNQPTEKQKPFSARKTPPVIEQKSRKENTKPPSKRDLSSDSSSSSEELPKFTPKPIRDSVSHPNLSGPISSNSSESYTQIKEPEVIKSKYRAEPVNGTTNSPHGSKSMDNISAMIPAMEPTRKTKPIGAPTRPISSQGQGAHRPHNTTGRPRNPHSQKRNPNSLQPSNIRKIR